MSGARAAASSAPTRRRTARPRHTAWMAVAAAASLSGGPSLRPPPPSPPRRAAMGRGDAVVVHRIQRFEIEQPGATVDTNRLCTCTCVSCSAARSSRRAASWRPGVSHLRTTDHDHTGFCIAGHLLVVAKPARASSLHAPAASALRRWWLLLVSAARAPWRPWRPQRTFPPGATRPATRARRRAVRPRWVGACCAACRLFACVLCPVEEASVSSCWGGSGAGWG